MKIVKAKGLDDYDDYIYLQGYIDEAGKLIIPTEHEAVVGEYSVIKYRNFSDGLVAVYKNGKYGYLDKNGKLVIPYSYESAGNFNGGVTAVSKNGKFGVINKANKLIVPFKFNWLEDYSEGLAAYKTTSLYDEGKFGFIDQTGKIVIPAKWNEVYPYLSRQLPLAKSAGYGGVDGLKKVVAMNQVAINTAGNQDEAGNNVVNLLQKINSREFKQQISKQIAPQAGDPLLPKSKGGGLDWSEYARQQKAKGVDQIDAFVALLEREMAGNSQYQDLKRQASEAKGEEAKALYEQMTNMFEGSALGEVIADRQALMAALAISQNGAENERIKSGLDGASGTIDGLYELFKGDEWATAMARQQEALGINYTLYTQVNEQLSAFNSAAAGFMENHAGLATAAYGAGLALATLGTIATVGGLLGGVGAGAAGGAAGGLLGRAGGVLGRAGGAVGRGVWAGASALVSASGAAVGYAGVGGYAFGTILSKALIEKNADLSDKIGGTIHTALANLGFESSQQALEAHFNSLIQQSEQTQTKQDQMVNEQTQSKQIQTQMLSQQAKMIAQQSQMIGQLQAIASKPVPSFNPNITIAGRPLAINMMEEIGNQSKRGKFGPFV